MVSRRKRDDIRRKLGRKKVVKEDRRLRWREWRRHGLLRRLAPRNDDSDAPPPSWMAPVRVGCEHPTLAHRCRKRGPSTPSLRAAREAIHPVRGVENRKNVMLPAVAVRFRLH